MLRKKLSRSGYCLLLACSIQELLSDGVQHIIKNKERPNPFNDGRSDRRYKAVFKRHPELRKQTVQPFTSARSGVSEEKIRNQLAEIKLYLEEEHGGKVIAKKGNKNVFSANNDHENLTELNTANAAGNITPPMIVFGYERIPSHTAYTVPPSWRIGKSESGCMCGRGFYEENEIGLISLYPDSMHLLQPLDVAFIHSLKAAWRKEVRKWRVNHFGNKFKK
ncbi:hypothetical protein PR048_027660 [Dryococelus australis]|uniref:Uncharacterized protein n=1 Tax=Dryococelus australis TaxID=614101 RepID=A0ABQ9GH54_9NEOP|nr:hypothetical protein PR048_027660 [Dryococelus australis]